MAALAAADINYHVMGYFPISPSTEIAQNIVQVARAAQNTAEGANNTQLSAQELSRMAQGLQRLVDEYRL